jgi:hypothetical protein
LAVATTHQGDSLCPQTADACRARQVTGTVSVKHDALSDVGDGDVGAIDPAKEGKAPVDYRPGLDEFHLSLELPSRSVT